MDSDSDSSADDLYDGFLSQGVELLLQDNLHPCPCLGASANSQDIVLTPEQLEQNRSLFEGILSCDVSRLVELAKLGILQNQIRFRAQCTFIGSTCVCRCASSFERFRASRQDVLDQFLNAVSSGQCNHCSAGPTQAPAASNGYDHFSVVRKESWHPGVNALHLAVLCGDPAIVLWLLKNTGIDINAPTCFHGDSPLHLAILRHNMELVSLLVDHGADVTLSSVHTGQSTVMHAVQQNSPDILKYLVDRGADVNKGVPNGPAPVLHAVRLGYSACVEILVKAGVDQAQTGYKAESLLCIALDRSRFRIAELLLEGDACVNKDMADRHGNRFTPLLMAMCRIGQSESRVDIVAKLLAKGANPNAVAGDGHFPLHFAAFSDLRKSAKLLLDYGANANQPNDNGYCALHHAAWDGRLEICKLLLAAGAQHDARTGDKNTPLSLACHGDRLDVIALLLQRPCDVNNADKDHDMPLHYTTFNGNADASRMLLDRGADPDAQNDVSATPLWNAVYAKRVEIVRMLLERNVRLQVASKGIQQHSMSATVQCVYTAQRTPLSVTWERRHIKGDSPEMFQLLLLAGARVDEETEPWIGALRESPPAEPRDACTRGRWLRLLNTPLSLKCAARIAIRRLIGVRMPAHIRDLELPTTLNDYLLMREL